MPRGTISSIADLLAAGLVDPAATPGLNAVAANYPVAITPALAALIQGDPADPIARQFVPDPRELVASPEERADPIGDDAFTPVRGLVHRHRDRVLLKPVLVCPVYCRFCFRREFVGPGEGARLSDEEIAGALAYIAAGPEIWEVILTGGDPLMLSPRRIRDLNAGLAAIAHVRILRWHSRVPVADPARVDDDLVAALASTDRTVYLAIHANHPRELTVDVRSALARLADAGIGLLSQTVLLRGVNDDASTLEALFRTFVENRVKPYYLHHPDLAPGTAHFRVSVAEGRAIARELRRRLSGIALPTYVLDIPGGHGKVPLAEDPFAAGDGTVTDLAGTQRAYPQPDSPNSRQPPSRS